MKALEVEILIAKYFNPRVNIVVPNVFWGMAFNHECDLFILTPSNCGYEVEIKVDKYDLIKDKNKPHGHNSKKIKRLYFAIPEYLESEIEHIPERAGVISIRKNKYGNKNVVKKLREAKNNSTYKFTEDEKMKLLHLAAMRIFPLKNTINNMKKQAT